MTTTTEIDSAVRDASDIAAGHREADEGENAIKLRGSDRDLNCKLRGTEWHRMVWRDGAWVYYADHLPRVDSIGRAATRKCSTSGLLYGGEIVAQHDKGGEIDVVYVVVDGLSAKSGKHGYLYRVSYSRQRDGLRIQLPTGTSITLPDPRRRVQS